MPNEINHTLKPGDELTDEDNATITIEDVHDDGSVSAREVREDGFEDEHEWSEEEICGALVDGNLTRTDGKSHELVKSF